MLMRATSIPARISSRSFASDSEAGPIVATIFALRIDREESLSAAVCLGASLPILPLTALLAKGQAGMLASPVEVMIRPAPDSQLRQVVCRERGCSQSGA